MLRDFSTIKHSCPIDKNIIFLYILLYIYFIIIILNGLNLTISFILKKFDNLRMIKHGLYNSKERISCELTNKKSEEFIS